MPMTPLRRAGSRPFCWACWRRASPPPDWTIETTFWTLISCFPKKEDFYFFKFFIIIPQLRKKGVINQVYELLFILWVTLVHYFLSFAHKEELTNLLIGWAMLADKQWGFNPIPIGWVSNWILPAVFSFLYGIVFALNQIYPTWIGLITFICRQWNN